MKAELLQFGTNSVVLRAYHPTFPERGGERFKDVDLTDIADRFDTVNEPNEELNAICDMLLKDNAEEDKNMKQHNPDGLNELQYGASEGWRLLDADEIDRESNKIDGIQLWDRILNQWDENTWGGRSILTTYRTRLTCDELAEKRGIKPVDVAEDLRLKNNTLGVRISHLKNSLEVKEELAKENALLKAQMKELSEKLTAVTAERDSLLPDKAIVDEMETRLVQHYDSAELFHIDLMLKEGETIRQMMPLFMAQQPSEAKETK